MKQKKLQWLFSTNKFLLPAANFLQFFPPRQELAALARTFSSLGKNLLLQELATQLRLKSCQILFCKECTYAELFTSTFARWKEK